MKIIPTTTPGYTRFSIVFQGLDGAKGQAVQLYKSLVEGRQFRPDELAIVHGKKMDTWWVSQTNESKKQPVIKRGDLERNANGYRAPLFGFNPTAV